MRNLGTATAFVLVLWKTPRSKIKLSVLFSYHNWSIYHIYIYIYVNCYMPLKKAGLYTNTRKDVCYEVNYVGAVGSKLDLNCWGSICRVSVWRCDCVTICHYVSQGRLFSPNFVWTLIHMIVSMMLPVRLEEAWRSLSFASPTPSIPCKCHCWDLFSIW